MNFTRAQIVRSLAGHDKGAFFCVLDTEGDFLLLADGKHRRVEAPKRKRAKHVQLAGTLEHPAIDKVRAGQPVRNRELRSALAAFRSQMEV